MLFKPHHIEKIRDGRKTATRRTWDSPQVKPGNRYMATTAFAASAEKCDTWIKVFDVYEQPLGEMTDEDAKAEGAETVDLFKATWEDIVHAWDPEEDVYVVEFEYVGEEKYPEEIVDALEW